MIVNYDKSTESLILNCEIECLSDNDFNVSWFISNGTESYLINKTRNFVNFTLNNSDYNFTETRFVYCRVSDLVNYSDETFQNESITYFHLEFYDPTGI